MLLLKKDMNKLFKFYWKKENQMLILQGRCYFVDCFSFSFFSSLTLIFFYFFHFLIFNFFFFNFKEGFTPLHIAVQKGYEQIVQLLLEKGKPNVNLANKVIVC